MIATTPAGGLRQKTRRRLSLALSLLATLLLVPFLLLPYRWLWLPCAIGGTVPVLGSRRSSWDFIRGRDTFVVGPPIVLILRTALDPEWWLPWIAVVVLVLWLRTCPWFGRGARGATVLFVWGVAVGWLAHPISNPFDRRAASRVPHDAVLVCAGDSLTSGLDHRSDAETYVARLRNQLPCRVINAGVANDKVSDLTARLDNDVLKHRPTAVLLFIGSNDYLNGTPRSEFAAGLETLVGRIASAGPRLLIVEVPSGIVWNPYAGVYRKVARRHHAPLVPESRLRWWLSFEVLMRDALSDPLTSDGIHLSSSGASRVADWLEPWVVRVLTDHLDNRRP